mgnify:CR=1 FL=1|jgi:ubiquinone/menaquinone biosynthesis C-methylase UbiE
MKKKTFTEEMFDKTFASKENIKYSFDLKKLGKRDQKIVKTLNSFGIDGKRCLDIGPGTGRWLQFLKKNKAAYIAAVDISHIALKNIENVCDFSEKVDVEVEDLPFEENSFDIIISFMVLEHIRNPSNYIAEMIRVAKNGAIILLTIPNIVSFVSRVRVLSGIMPLAVTGDSTHVRFYTKKELIKLFDSYNIKPELIPTSISLNPLNSNKLKIPSNNITKSLDDHLLIKLIVKK